MMYMILGFIIGTPFVLVWHNFIFFKKYSTSNYSYVKNLLWHNFRLLFSLKYIPDNDKETAVQKILSSSRNYTVQEFPYGICNIRIESKNGLELLLQIEKKELRVYYIEYNKLLLSTILSYEFNKILEGWIDET